LASELAGTVVPTPYGMVRLTRAAFQRASGLPRSAFYRPIERPARSGDQKLVGDVRKILTKHPKYGYRQITDRLRRAKWTINPKRVLRVMRTHGLLAKPLWRPKWRGGVGATGDLPNLSRFAPNAPDQLWLTDFTFVPLRGRWIYLAVLLDAFSRRCIGWALGTSITADLAIGALRMALTSRRPRATLIHHSDRGSQYASARYEDILSENDIRQSFSRPGTPTDNPVCERFIGTLKREEIRVRTYIDFEDAERSIGAFIVDYNQHRSHSSLGKRSPIEFERTFHQVALGHTPQAILDVP
jgi:putative transposase